MAYTNPKLELTVPEEAGPRDPRIVVTRNVPLEVQSIFAEPVVAGVLFYFESDDANASDEYGFIVAENAASGGHYQIHLGMARDGTALELQKWTIRATDMSKNIETYFDNLAFNWGNTSWYRPNGFNRLSFEHDPTDANGIVMWFRNTGGAADTYIHRAEGPTRLSMSPALEVSGTIRSGGEDFGSVVITPVASTVTSVTVTGLNISGSNFYGYATPVAGNHGGNLRTVCVNNVDNNSLEVNVYRLNNTDTTVNWQVKGRD